MAKINVDIKSTLDKAGFDATAKAVKQLQSEVDSSAAGFDKFGNVSGTVSSAIQGDIKGVSNGLLGLTKSLKNVGGALGGLAQAVGPLALVATIATAAWQAIKTLQDKIKKAREEAEAARIQKQADDLRELKNAYTELTAQIDRYAKAQQIAADNAAKMQNAANGLQNSKLAAAMNDELRNARTGEERDQIKQKYSRYAEDLKDAQALRNIELEMSKNQAEIAKQEKLASEAARFYNSQLDAKNKLIDATAKKIANAEGFTGGMGEAMNQAANDSAVKEAVEAEKAARANAENARNELAKLKAAQDVLKVKQAEVKQNSENARTARELEDKAKLEADHAEALNAAIKTKNDLCDKVAKAEEALVRAQEQEKNKARTKELQAQLDLLNQQVAKAKELLGIANQQNGGKGRVENVAQAEKQAAKEAKELDRQRKADEKRLEAIEKRSLGGKFAKDVNGNYYLRSMTGEDITGKLNKRDAEFVRRLNEINAAENAANMAQANINAVKGQIEAAQNQLAPDAVEAAKDAVKTSKEEAEAAQETINGIENKFAADIVSLEESFANYQEELKGVIEQINAPAASAVETLNANFADLKQTLKALLTAQ
jgi:hypothetical protein